MAVCIRELALVDRAAKDIVYLADERAPAQFIQRYLVLAGRRRGSIEYVDVSERPISWHLHPSEALSLELQVLRCRTIVTPGDLLAVL